MPIDPASILAGKAAIASALASVDAIRDVFVTLFVAGEITAEQMAEIELAAERSDADWDERVRRARERLRGDDPGG